MILSEDQKKVLNKLLSWFKKRGKTSHITLGGYAGTGKTTLISVLRKKINQQNGKAKASFCSYTGKAARTLESKLKETESFYPQDSVSTIHSLIYSPLVNKNEEIIGWERRSEVKTDLIIIDEASMVDFFIWQDLLSYQIPIIAVGDHGQLPPINGSFNLMEKPMLKLEKIHRQAENNPIIKLSILAREEGEIPEGGYGPNILKIRRDCPESGEMIEQLLLDYNPETLILCGYNSTRVRINNFIRKSLDFDSIEPQVRDRVICLRNNHTKKIYNGMLGTIKSIYRKSDHWYFAEIQMDGEEARYQGLIYADQFGNKDSVNFTSDRQLARIGDLFDFGYALTVHKAQGSEAKRVILFEERFGRMTDSDWRRWLYTGVTRAQEQLFIIGT
ncbi:MAG: ATP-dependent RecD-like DNA helicase [Patescibacteria group bacterium]|nr:ATP-dependent RecD-like DNA helicase [Patescibacteria group bacterium]